MRKYIGHGAGYLLNDNRAAHQGVEEADIILCPHCQKVIKLSQWKAADGSGANGWCSKCQAPCCGNGPCAADFAANGCRPFMARIDAVIKAEYSRLQFRKVAGLEPEQPTLTYRGPPTS